MVNAASGRPQARRCATRAASSTIKNALSVRKFGISTIFFLGTGEILRRQDRVGSQPETGCYVGATMGA